MSNQPDLFDYLVFFEAEPEWTHPEGWFHGVRFCFTTEHEKVIATLAPDEGEFALEWYQGEILRLKIDLVRVGGWKIESLKGVEYLRVGVDVEHVRYFILQLKPVVACNFFMSWGGF